jgi:hypothetical protein
MLCAVSLTGAKHSSNRVNINVFFILFNSLVIY